MHWPLRSGCLLLPKDERFIVIFYMNINDILSFLAAKSARGIVERYSEMIRNNLNKNVNSH